MESARRSSWNTWTCILLRHLKAETFWCVPYVCKKYIRNILFNAVKGTHFIRLMQEFSSTTSYSIIFKDVIFKYIFFYGKLVWMFAFWLWNLVLHLTIVDFIKEVTSWRYQPLKATPAYDTFRKCLKTILKINPSLVSETESMKLFRGHRWFC